MSVINKSVFRGVVDLLMLYQAGHALCEAIKRYAAKWRKQSRCSASRADDELLQT